MIAKNVKAIQWSERRSNEPDGAVRTLDEWVAREVTLTIVVNGEELVRLSSSPVHCVDLGLGFLITEGVISRASDVVHSDFDPADGRITFTLSPERSFRASDWLDRRTITSGCGNGVTLAPDLPQIGVPLTADNPCVPPEYFGRLFALLREDHALWYERTGCVHLAILAACDGPPLIREDIGRHNAVDKVVGAAAHLNLPLSRAILGSTGRLSSEMVRKAAFAGIPVVASRSAPTSLAIELAEASGITLIGFARNQRINIYTHAGRIGLQSPAESGPCACSGNFNPFAFDLPSLPSEVIS